MQVFLTRCCSVLFLFSVVGYSSLALADINKDKPPFSLTLEQAKNWSAESVYADSANVSHVPLKSRFSAVLDKDHSAHDTRVKVLIAPDGMNNFANYLQPQSTFNLYNFTHWSQIDVLNWFAGTATQTVNIPARPWVETAHKNGVKVIGSVFLAITQWGGDRKTVAEFLQQDKEGRFILAHQLVAMAEYYAFDGWLMNQETDLTLVKDAKGKIIKGKRAPKEAAELAIKMRDFMAYLTEIAPDEMEIHWYDAMLEDGSVRWQNQLNSKNLPFFQRNEQRVSDSIFLNYWWDAKMVKSTHKVALNAGRSPFDVYFGADLWPARNAQAMFRENQWLDDLFDEQGKGKTSIALFANNANFNFPGHKGIPPISRFEKEVSDYQAYYRAETRLFSGDDLNQVNDDPDGAWKGIGHYVPAKSALNSLPFETQFNTGHGLYRFQQGKKVGAQWHDMGQQSGLPTWQFAVYGDKDLSVAYHFEDAWQGGASLGVTAVKVKTKTRIPLYQTEFLLGDGAHLSVVTKSQNNEENQFSLMLSFSDRTDVEFALQKQGSQWKPQQVSLVKWQGKTLTRISMVVNESSQPVEFFLGQLAIREGAE